MRKAEGPLQCLPSLPPGTGGLGPVPLLFQVLGAKQQEIRLPLHGQMLEAVVQDEQLRTQMLPSPGRAPGPHRIHHHAGLGSGQGQHERFVPGLGRGAVRLHQIGQGRRMGLIAPAQDHGFASRGRGPAQQPLRKRRLTTAAPGDIAHRNAGTGRLEPFEDAARIGCAPQPHTHGPGPAERGQGRKKPMLPMGDGGHVPPCGRRAGQPPSPNFCSSRTAAGA